MERIQKLYIPTLDPRGTEGVRSVTQFTYHTAEKLGYDPHIVFNAIPWEEGITIKDIFKCKLSHRYEETTIDDLRGTVIGRIFPEIESLNYITTYKKWMRTIEEGIIFGVGGAFFPCLPAAISNSTYGCWIGTLIHDERAVQMSEFSKYRRLRYKIERPVLEQLERITLERADRLLVQSKYTKRRICEKYDIPESEIEYLPFPVDTERFSPDDNVDTETDIVFVGRFNDPRKNIEMLVRAFKSVLQNIPDATLTLVGDQPGDKLSTLISDLNLDDAIRTPGRVPDIVPYLRRSQVFVLPSRQEGLGIAGLEAMSCGLPVVATKCGGPEDYVIDGKTGYLVPVGDEKELARQLSKILDSTDLYREMGENARELIKENYEVSKIQGKIERVLKDI
jgi:glycosyltransferase involved in cell wall biosynthesis